MKIFPLGRYVARRDPMGDLLELITEEHVSVMDLPEEIQEKLVAKLVRVLLRMVRKS